MKFWGFLVSLFFVTVESSACDFQITKTAGQLNSQTHHKDLCLQDYFQQRNLGFQSLSRDAVNYVIISDLEKMYFDDMLLFEMPHQKGIPLEKAGRLKWVKEIYIQYFASLKNEYGACSLRLYSGKELLSLNDFIPTERDVNGQPGSRLMLTKDDIQNPSWELACPSATGAMEVSKKGKYFFMFVDIYENKNLTQTQTHFSQFLFSLQ